MPAIKKTKATEPYLKTLGLDKVNAETEITEEQINKAWKKLSVKIHPDKATNAVEKKELEAKFIASTQARDALIALANDAVANLKANTKAEAEAAAQAAVRQQAQRQFSSAQQPSSGLGVMKTRHMPSFILIVPVGKMASIIDESSLRTFTKKSLRQARKRCLKSRKKPISDEAALPNRMRITFGSG